MAWGKKSNKKAAGSASGSGWSDEVPEGHSQARRTPTDSSYYDLDGQPTNKNDPNAPTWIYARDVRAQQAKAPVHPTARQKYPSYFYNAEGIPLSTAGHLTSRGNNQWLHQPMIPGKATAYQGGKVKPGSVRTFYTEGDRAHFDVGFHDPRIARPDGTHPFTLATYVPKAK
ncbi:hypothetical protein GGR57DRAFT_502272 [Xylariaceae sp. FL1272]|nr:hypothetical protein GGR57DRAFT_502272 [Xylariaceae sp. FL1272]